MSIKRVIEQEHKVLKRLATAIVEAIHEVPNGVTEGILYVAFQSAGFSFDAFNAALEIAMLSGAIRREGRLYYPNQITEPTR